MFFLIKGFSSILCKYHFSELNIKNEILSMPGYFQLSLDLIEKEVTIEVFDDNKN